MLVESTAHCLRSHFVLFALEELGKPYQTLVRPADYFSRELSTVGPVINDEGLRFLELNVALRHIARSTPLLPEQPQRALEVETWLELQATWLRPAGVRLRVAAGRGERDEEAERLFARCLRRHEQALLERDYLAGEFSLADCTAPFLLRCRDSGFALPTGTEAYLGRIEARPGWQRARARAEMLALQAPSETSIPLDLARRPFPIPPPKPVPDTPREPSPSEEPSP